MSPNIDDRELAKFRDASGTLSKVAVTLEQDSDNPIPVIFGGGIPFFISNELPTIPDTDIDLISFLYSGTDEMRLTSFGISCHIEGTASLYIDGNYIYSIRTNAGLSNADFMFKPYYIVTGFVEVKFKARNNSAVTTASGFIQGNYITI
jgi:hypothetical protein